MLLHAAGRGAPEPDGPADDVSSEPPIRVLLDFDGTITLEDTVDRLLERFAQPEWRRIERAWEAGDIGSRECLERQTALLRAAPEALDALIDAVPLDPGFAPLVRRCRDLDLELLIVSDGYDRAIRRVLSRAGLAIPFVSNVLQPLGDDRWRLCAPSCKASCRVEAAHCKCARVPPAGAVVLIGDGRSDFCVAHAAQYVIAKGRLAAYCKQKHLPSVAVFDLEEAADALETWVRIGERGTSLPITRGEIA